MKIEFIDLDNNGLKYKEYSFKIHLNHLCIINQSSSGISENEQLFDIDSIYKTNQSIAVPLILTPNWLQIFNLKYAKRVYIILLLFLFVYVLNYVFQKLEKRAKGKIKIDFFSVEQQCGYRAQYFDHSHARHYSDKFDFIFYLVAKMVKVIAVFFKAFPCIGLLVLRMYQFNKRV